MYKWDNPTLYNGYNYLSLLGFKLVLVRKRAICLDKGVPVDHKRIFRCQYLQTSCIDNNCDSMSHYNFVHFQSKHRNNVSGQGMFYSRYDTTISFSHTCWWLGIEGSRYQLLACNVFIHAVACANSISRFDEKVGFQYIHIYCMISMFPNNEEHSAENFSTQDRTIITMTS